MKNREFTRKIVKFIRDEMDKLTDDELDQIIQDCNNLNQTNCDWLEYRLVNPISENASALIHTHQYWKNAVVASDEEKK